MSIRESRVGLWMTAAMLVMPSCAAIPISALALAGTAIGGFGAYKAVQTLTDGSAEVRVLEVTATGKPSRVIRTVAVMNGSRISPLISDAIQLEGTELDVLTPFQVEQSTSAPIAATMNTNEMRAALQGMAVSLGVDGVLHFEERGGGIATNAFSFKRGESQMDFVVTFTSGESPDPIWAMKGQLAIKMGGSWPAQDDLDGLVASCVAGEFLRFIHFKDELPRTDPHTEQTTSQ